MKEAEEEQRLGTCTYLADIFDRHIKEPSSTALADGVVVRMGSPVDAILHLCLSARYWPRPRTELFVEAFQNRLDCGICFARFMTHVETFMKIL